MNPEQLDSLMLMPPAQEDKEVEPFGTCAVA